MNLVERAKNIILTPQSEWAVIHAESNSAAELYKNYIIFLAAIGPIAKFIGFSLVGVNFGFFGAIRTPILDGLTSGLLHYIATLVCVFLFALLIDVLAPKFGGEKNSIQALKVAAFAATPAWVGSALYILPSLWPLVLLASLYSIYVLYLGLPVLMKVSKEKQMPYTAALVICTIVAGVIYAAIAHSFGGYGAWPRHAGATISNSSEMAADLEKLKQVGAMAAANKQMAAADQSGNPQAQAEAAKAVAGALLSGSTAPVEPVDQNLLKAMLPETLGNLKRNKFEAEKVGMGAMAMSKASSGYGDAQGHVDLTITDVGGTMLRALAAWTLFEQDREDDNGYEKMGKVDGRPVHEKYNKKTMDGEYTVVVADRFLVEAQGQKVGMDILKQAVAAIDFSKLEAMKTSGAKQ